MHAPARLSRGRRVARRAAVAAESSASTSTPLGALGDGRFSKLLSALDVAQLTSAVAGASADAPLTVFAPTDAAFERACAERALAFEELAGRENLGEILKHHVVAGAVRSGDLKNGSVKTLSGRSIVVDVSNGVKVDGVKVTEADKEAFGGAVVVHVVDEVLFPAFSINAKVQTPQQILAFEGWAPEVINGRVAMLGFMLALAGEITTGESFTTQASHNFGELVRTMFVWSLASLFPAFSSNEGYEANPFKMAGSKEWEFVFRGCPPWLAVKDRFSPEAEQLNGRAAMVGCASLIVIESLTGHALFWWVAPRHSLACARKHISRCDVTTRKHVFRALTDDSTLVHTRRRRRGASRPRSRDWSGIYR